MMCFLIILLGIIFALHIPVTEMFRSYGYYRGVSTAPWVLDSVGNMGFSDAKCVLHHMVKGTQINATCEAGVINKFVAFGVHTDTED